MVRIIPTKEFYAYLQCGILAHGLVRLGCDACPHQMLLAFSCKKRGFCPSCAGRRMAQMAAHLVEEVIPWVPTRQWVVSVPIPLRYWMAPSRELTATVHTCPEMVCKVFLPFFSLVRMISSDWQSTAIPDVVTRPDKPTHCMAFHFANTETRCESI